MEVLNKVLDNSAISSMGKEIVSVDVLKHVLSNYEVYITSAVNEECMEYDGGRLMPLTHSMKQVNTTDQRYGRIMTRIRARWPWMGIGETATIAASLFLASQGKDNYAVIDDKKARKVAVGIHTDAHVVNIMGGSVPVLKVTGTVGLVRNLRDKGIITREESKKVASDLENSGFRVTSELLDILR